MEVSLITSQVAVKHGSLLLWRQDSDIRKPVPHIITSRALQKRNALPAKAWRENVVLHLLQGKGFVTAAEVEAQKGWAPGRVEDALDTLLKVRHARP